MRGTFLLMTLLLGLPFGVVGQDPVTGDPSVVFSGSRAELLFDEANFTEGPAVGPDGSVYFSDITFTNPADMRTGNIWRYDPTTGETSIFRSPSGKSNGIIFDKEDRMVVAEGADFGGRRITRTDLSTGRSEIVAGLFNGRPFNAPNDLTIDEQGRIFFTDPRYLGHEPIEQPIMGVYRIDPDGTVALVVTDAGQPNGILVSPDQSTLYVADYTTGSFGALPAGMRAFRGRRALLAYDLDSDGNATFREEVVREFAPDGMAIDVAGNLYLTGSGERVLVYSPTGDQLAEIPLPELAHNVTFGRGDADHMLYIAAGGSLYSVEVRNAGYHPVRH
jgi:gluconolactonase